MIVVRHAALRVWSWGALGAGLVLLAGCRIESPAETADGPAAPVEVPADPAPVRPSPPVVAGDTARVDSTEAAVASRTPAPALARAPSGLVLPVDGVGAGDLVDTFEAARSEGREHNAIDILAPRGTAVRAAVAGNVARLFTSDRGGLTVYQVGPRAPGGGVRVYYYAHLDAYAPGLAEGQHVAAGDVIGTVGDTGNAAPGNTHLHFAIWDAPGAEDFWDGVPVNPYPLLAR